MSAASWFSKIATSTWSGRGSAPAAEVPWSLPPPLVVPPVPSEPFVQAARRAATRPTSQTRPCGRIPRALRDVNARDSGTGRMCGSHSSRLPEGGRDGWSARLPRQRAELQQVQPRPVSGDRARAAARAWVTRRARGFCVT